MAYDIFDKTLVTNGGPSDILSQHIHGIGDAQIRAGHAEKSKILCQGILWVEKNIIECLTNRNFYSLGGEVDIMSDLKNDYDKLLFRNRSKFVPVNSKRES
jgi:hypothetical protein